MRIEHFLEEPEREALISEAMELSPEERLEIREQARSERLELLGSVFRSRLVAMGINFIPGFDVSKLAFEAARGKTIRGEELGGVHRLNYLIISGTFAMAYGMMLAGLPEEGLATLGAGASMAKLEFFGPHAKDSLLALFEKISGGARRIFMAGYEFMEDHEEESRHIVDELMAAYHPETGSVA